MKKILDKFKQPIRINKKMFVFLTLLIVIGMIAGSLFVTILSSDDKTMVKEYITNFMNLITSNKIDKANTMLNGTLNSLFYFLAIWLLGISVIGIPIVIFSFFIKAFTLGFSLGSLFYVYQAKGILYAIIYVCPSQLINLFLYSLMTLYSISLSIKIIYSMIKKKKLDFRVIMNRYTMILMICLLFSVLTNLYEAFVMPPFLKWVASMITT